MHHRAQVKKSIIIRHRQDSEVNMKRKKDLQEEVERSNSKNKAPRNLLQCRNCSTLQTQFKLYVRIYPSRTISQYFMKIERSITSVQYNNGDPHKLINSQMKKLRRAKFRSGCVKRTHQMSCIFQNYLTTCSQVSHIDHCSAIA